MFYYIYYILVKYCSERKFKYPKQSFNATAKCGSNG